MDVPPFCITFPIFSTIFPIPIRSTATVACAAWRLKAPKRPKAALPEQRIHTWMGILDVFHGHFMEHITKKIMKTSMKSPENQPVHGDMELSNIWSFHGDIMGILWWFYRDFMVFNQWYGIWWDMMGCRSNNMIFGIWTWNNLLVLSREWWNRMMVTVKIIVDWIPHSPRSTSKITFFLRKNHDNAAWSLLIIMIRCF